MISNLEAILSGEEVLEEHQSMFEVDDKKAFLKLAENQLENPFDGLRELIANAIDSYYGTKKKPLIKIDTKSSIRGGDNSFTIIDYGTGMNDEKIRLLTTLGLSDKIQGEIGRFGIGFSSIFSPKLKTKKVTVDTNNNGKHYRLVFTPKANSVPSLKIYELNDEINFGTKIEINFRDNSVIYGIESRARTACKYMPHKIKLNRKLLETVSLEAPDISQDINIDENGLKGYIGFIPYSSNTLTLLSKFLLVESKEFKEFSDFKVLAGNWDSLNLFLPNIHGVINNDKFDLVLSRNQVVEDREFLNTKAAILSKCPDLLSKLLDKHVKDPLECYRRVILKNIAGNKQFFRRAALEMLGCEKQENAKCKLVEKLFDAGVFQLWGGNYLSLRQIHHKIKQGGYIIFSSEKNLINILDDKDTRNVLAKKERDMTNQEDLFRGLYGQESTVIDLDTSNIKELADKNMIKLHSSADSKEINETTLNNSQKAFLEEVRYVLSIKKVRALMRKYGLPSKVPVSYVEIEDHSVIAQYNRSRREVHLNQNNSLVQNFAQSKNPKRNALYFIPLLSHELTHDELTGHLEDFYNKNSALDSEMRMIIANYIANQKAGRKKI